MAVSKAPRFAAAKASSPGPGAYYVVAPSQAAPGPKFSFGPDKAPAQTRCKGQIALPNLLGFLRKSNVLNDGYKNVPGKLPEVNLAELAMTEFIGKGGLATVQRTWWNGRELAAKVLCKLEHVLPGQSEEDREALAKEARVLLQAQKGCRRIVHVFAQIRSGNEVEGLLLELFGPTLSKRFESNDFSCEELRQAFGDACLALRHLHLHFIAHNDLNLGNIAREQASNRYKLLDHDACLELTSKDDRTLRKPRTLAFASPEALRGGTPHSPKMTVFLWDVFSSSEHVRWQNSVSQEQPTWLRSCSQCETFFCEPKNGSGWTLPQISSGRCWNRTRGRTCRN